MNAIFQQTVADQRATRALLTKAVQSLYSFYGTKGAALVSQPAGAPPPADFKKQEKNAQSGGVVGMIEQIIADAKVMEEEALKGEEEEQIAYESLVAETNEAIVAAQRAVTKKTGNKSRAEGSKEEKEVELSAVTEELEALGEANRDLHVECDYLLKNFDAKQSSRDDEIGALKESVAILNAQKLLGTAPADATVPPPR